MKLSVKMLWIPIGVLLVIFLFMGIIFTTLIVKNSSKTLDSNIMTLLEGERSQLKTGLLLMTASRTPSDAILMIEAEDYSVALDMEKQVKGMGLDSIYILDMQGKQLYPKISSIKMPDVINDAIKKTANDNTVEIALVDKNMVGYATIFDDKKPKGFLVFVIKVPDDLITVAEQFFKETKDTKDLSEKRSERLSNIYNDSKSINRRFLNKTYMIIAFTIIIAMVLVVIALSVVLKNIIGRIKNAVEMFKLATKGDLRVKIEDKDTDELGTLAECFNTFMDSIQNMIAIVKSGIDNVNLSMKEVYTLSQKILSGTNEQSERTSQVSAASHEMSASIVEVAKNVSGVASAANSTNMSATTGSAIVTKSVNSITTIADSTDNTSKVISTLGQRSYEIGNIVRVIDDIADQTNLLALNAAIEAARAGEYGRGFAVVADEVRKLSESTTRATKEIGDMIKVIQADTKLALSAIDGNLSSVKEGVQFSVDAGKALKEIVNNVGGVSNMIQNIVATSEEQSRASDAISQDIDMVAHITADTSKIAEQMAEASKEVEQLVIELLNAMNMFKIN